MRTYSQHHFSVMILLAMCCKGRRLPSFHLLRLRLWAGSNRSTTVCIAASFWNLVRGSRSEQETGRFHSQLLSTHRAYWTQGSESLKRRIRSPREYHNNRSAEKYFETVRKLACPVPVVSKARQQYRLLCFGASGGFLFV